MELNLFFCLNLSEYVEFGMVLKHIMDKMISSCCQSSWSYSTLTHHTPFGVWTFIEIAVGGVFGLLPNLFSFTSLACFLSSTLFSYPSFFRFT
ncbi:hypothetical protein L1887_16281 [Cichorium endivia]|nr:hypothetical protein L1887_16281 [Cichorium endivia]